MLRHCSR